MRSLLVGFMVVLGSAEAVEAAPRAGAIHLSPPDGWARTERAGAVLFSAPGTSGSEGAVLAVPSAQAPAGWPASFEKAWAAIKADHRDIEEVPATGGERGGYAFRIAAGSMAEAAGRFLYVTFFAARNGKAMQPVIFVATNAKLYDRYAGEVEKALRSVTFAADASPGRGGIPKLATLVAPAPASAAAPTAPEAPSSNTPASSGSLVGRWSSGSVSPVGFYNAGTGEWAPPTGAGQSYELRPDGTYVYAGLLQTSLYGCTSRVFIYNTGTWKAGGGKLVLREKTARTRSVDTCNKKFNYEKSPKTKTEILPWRMEADSSGQWLVLTTDTGELRLVRKD